MLVKSNQNGIYEKIVRAKNGQLFRVQFTVISEGGILRGRMLSMEAIVGIASKAVSVSSSSDRDVSIVCLPATVEKDIHDSVAMSLQQVDFLIPAPLDFLTSQPTRAPSFN